MNALGDRIESPFDEKIDVLHGDRLEAHDVVLEWRSSAHRGQLPALQSRIPQVAERVAQDEVLAVHEQHPPLRVTTRNRRRASRVSDRHAFTTLHCRPTLAVHLVAELRVFGDPFDHFVRRSGPPDSRSASRRGPK